MEVHEILHRTNQVDLFVGDVIKQCSTYIVDKNKLIFQNKL